MPLSEWLHFCYLSYVVMIPAVAAYWYIANRRQAFHELILALAIAMFGSYLFFILFPVDSPYYLTPRLGPPIANNFFFDLVHAVSDRGAPEEARFRVAMSLVLSYSGRCSGVISHVLHSAWPR